MAFIETCRLREHPSLKSADDVTLAHLADATCGAVENFTNRKFTLTEYDELYPATRSRNLFLNQYPVTRIKAVRSGQTPAVQVQNTQANIQAATVEIKETGLTLTRTTNASDTVNTLSWTAYPTLGQLATAITALSANGWSASCNGQFSGWASTDLAVYRGSYSARQSTVFLSPHYQYASGYQLNPVSGELVFGSGWGGGIWSYRVQYTAGFDAIPEELISATVELAAATFRASKADPNLVSESLGSYSYTRAATKSLADLSVTAYQTLRHYRKPRVPYFGVS